jgi:hypothetical protein
MRSPGRASHTTVVRLRGALVFLAFCAVFFLATAARAMPKTDSGAAFGPVLVRPSSLPVRSCDPSAPVCVHARAESAALVPALRHAVADAWSLTVDTLRVPRPLPDGGEGGDPRLDVYLLPGNAQFSDGLAVGHDALDRPSDRDAAPAFVAISEELVRSGGCALPATATRAIVRASADGLDLAEDPIVVDGFARHMAELAAPCSALDRMAEIQKTPWRSMVATPFGPQLLARTLDVQRGVGFGAVVPGLFSMAIGHHGVVIPKPDDDLGPAHFQDDPSIFDVLSASLTDANYSLDELYLDVGSVRARAAIPPAWEWDLKASSLPRRFAIRRGIEPTGYTFFRIEVDKHSSIEMDIAWEQGARFLWRIIELDAAGKVVYEMPVTRLETARKLTVEVRHLENVKTLILVGFNAGDPARLPWRSTEPPAQGHGYEIGIYPGT